MNTNAEQVWRILKEQLATLYPKDEAQSIAFQVLEAKYGCSRTDMVLQKPLEIDQDALRQLIDRLLTSEPLQYILGKAHFYGMDLLVSPDTLIPRPETEELVHWIAQNRAENTIMDIGTGTGCIALALKKQFPQATIHAVDVSKKALEIAKANAENQRLPINFHQLDVLREDLPIGGIDILVSNPPYVLEEEKAQMRKNVLAYEPKGALFVPNHLPLLFYERIALLGRSFLADGGYLYFEINEAFGQATVDMLDQQGYQNIELRQDMQGVDRMVKAQFFH